MILYFSGTENSKFVAEQMAKQLGDTTVSANEIIKNGIYDPLKDEKRFVIVSPIYAFAPVKTLETLLRQVPLVGAKKVWFVMTGAGKLSVSKFYWKKYAKEKGLDYMGTAHIKMPQNYIVYFNLEYKQKNEKTIAEAIPEIEELSRLVNENTAFTDNDMGKAYYLLTAAVRGPYYALFIKSKKFRAENTCICCGKCATVCPLNNISIHDGKPIWGKKCTHCMACINLCPSKSIEYGNKTVGKNRYNFFK